MTTAEMILQKKTVYKAEMDKIMPVEQSDALWQKAAGKLDSIMEQYGLLPKGVKMHTDKIFPAAAVYLTVKDAVGGEKAYHIIENAAVIGCADIEKKLQKLMKVPGMRSLFVAVWDPMTKKLFGPSSGFQNRFYPKKKGEYRMDIVSCPYNRYFTELGCPELTKIFCECGQGHWERERTAAISTSGKYNGCATIEYDGRPESHEDLRVWQREP